MSEKNGDGIPERELRDDYGIWNTKPEIKGFNQEELEQIYSGNFTAILERFKNMNNKERDAEILRLEPEFTIPSQLLIGQIDHTTNEEKDRERANICDKHLKNLDAFQDKLRELYQGEEK